MKGEQALQAPPRIVRRLPPARPGSNFDMLMRAGSTGNPRATHLDQPAKILVARTRTHRL